MRMLLLLLLLPLPHTGLAQLLQPLCTAARSAADQFCCVRPTYQPACKKQDRRSQANGLFTNQPVELS